MLQQTKNVRAKWLGKVLVAYKDSAVRWGIFKRAMKLETIRFYIFIYHIYLSIYLSTF